LDENSSHEAVDVGVVGIGSVGWGWVGGSGGSGGIGRFGEVQNAPAGDEVLGVGIVFWGALVRWVGGFSEARGEREGWEEGQSGESRGVLTNVSDGLVWDRGGRWWGLRDTVGCNLCIDQRLPLFGPRWLLFCHVEPWNGFMWVVHVVGGISKSVDLKLIQQVLGNLIKKPVDDHAALDSTLRVDNKNDFVVLGVLERCFDFDIRVSDIQCGVAETSLYQTLYHVEYDTCCWIVDA
jgi:hypothetical protein